MFKPVRRLLAGIVLALLAATPAWADLRVVVPFATYRRGDTITDAAAITAILASSNAVNVVTIAGGGAATINGGIDASNNPIAIPGTAALKTLDVNMTRRAIVAQNESVYPILLVEDDGYGGNVTTFVLAPAATDGGAGQPFEDDFWRGRVRVWSTVAGTNPRFALRQH